MNPQDRDQRIMEVRFLEEQINQLEQQIAIVDKQIIETQIIQASLDDIKKIKKNDVFVPIGRDIFVESNIESAEMVLVNVGAGVFIKKEIEGAKKTIDNQNQKLFDLRKEVINEINKVFMRITEIEKEFVQ